MIEAFKNILQSQDFWAKAILEFAILGIILFMFQKYFEHRLSPLTASETLKRENFLNAKRDVYYEAIEIANREYAFIDFTDAAGKVMTNYQRDRGTKKPTEFEVNTCFSKLCIYSDDEKIPRLFKQFFLHDPNGKPIQVLEDFVNLLRKDLGYGDGIIKPRTDEYQYISIGMKDTIGK
ncbi:MAG TPA: hypothetical protein PKE17_13620 [Saprospiraceae bacterium]|nr:hypothetical protein [Saprospiraceae bacterium]